MKNLFPFLILFIFISCNTSNTAEEKPIEEIKEKTIVTSEIELPFLNRKEALEKGGFQGLKTLKDSTILMIKKHPKKQTEILYHFIKSYEEKPISENIKSDSFSLFYSTEMAEGDIYPAYNSSYLKVGVMELLDEINSRFLSLRCLEIMNKCCDDAAVIISREETARRALHWGELNNKLNEENLFKKDTRAYYNSYKGFLLEGPDNTPAFGFNNTYDNGYFNALKNIIQEHPNSLLTKEFKDLIILLEKENLRETAEVKYLVKEMLNE